MRASENYNTKTALLLAMMYAHETDVPITVIVNGQSFQARMEKLEVVKMVERQQDGFLLKGVLE